MEWQAVDLAKEFVPAATGLEEAGPGFVIAVSDREILAPEQGGFRPQRDEEWRAFGLETLSRHLLGWVDGVPLHVLGLDDEAEEPEGFTFQPLRSFLGRLDEAGFALLGRAAQTLDWHRQHRFCGRCGGATEAATRDRSLVCRACNHNYYPRLAPSIIVVVTRGKELLLARPARPGANFFTALAGFVEPGESLEQTVHREVFEEVGMRIHQLRYFGSQPWPFPNQLMLGFHAEHESGEIVLQEEELAEAGWFHYLDLPANRPGRISISGWLIDAAVERLAKAGRE